MTGTLKKSKEQLINELNCFLAHGYLDMDSYDEPLDEAADALRQLVSYDEQACNLFSKKILLSKDFGDVYLDSICLLHLFDIEKEYALKYVEENVKNMSTPVLQSTMDGLCQYSRTPFREKFTKELIVSIYHRYDELSQRPLYKEMLEGDYSNFQEDFPRHEDKV